jgi:hypothetical protein
MINGSFVFGFDCDRPDVFERTVEFAVENKIETATFHVLTPFPGTQAFAQMHAAGRILHRIWSLYDTRHAVFRPRGMTAVQLEEGYWRAYEDFYRYGSILERSFGLGGALKRIAYNVGWKKMDPVWSAILRSGLLPFVRPVFERVLARGSRVAGCPRAPQRASRVSKSRSHLATSTDWGESCARQRTLECERLLSLWVRGAGSPAASNRGSTPKATSCGTPHAPRR